jgi:hypothetical protein
MIERLNTTNDRITEIINNSKIELKEDWQSDIEYRNFLNAVGFCNIILLGKGLKPFSAEEFIKVIYRMYSLRIFEKSIHPAMKRNLKNGDRKRLEELDLLNNWYYENFSGQLHQTYNKAVDKKKSTQFDYLNGNEFIRVALGFVKTS